MNKDSKTLTKQLATESLPEYTEFYVRKKDGSTDTQTWLNRRHSSAVEWWNTFNITEVLAPVPSYEKWQEEQKALKVLAEAYCKEKEENQQLKELLETASTWIREPILKREIVMLQTLKRRINEALGEKK